MNKRCMGAWGHGYMKAWAMGRQVSKVNNDSVKVGMAVTEEVVVAMYQRAFSTNKKNRRCGLCDS